MAGHEREHPEWLSPKNDVAKAICYMLRADPMAFVHPLPRRSSDGRFCLSNNAAERALRCVAVGRRNWTFAGSDAGGPSRCSRLFTDRDLHKLNAVDPRAWLADVLAKLSDHPVHRIGEMMPWAWKARHDAVARVATAVVA